MQAAHSSSALAFFVVVFALSVPMWVLATVYPASIAPGLPLSALQALTPALGALILVYRTDHFSGAVRLLRRSFDFNRVRDKQWFLVILLLNPAIAVLAYVVIDATSEPLPWPAPLTFDLLPLAALFFVGALGEEIGWSGYATEPLLERWRILPASLILGAVWAIWHVVPLVQADRSVEWIAWWSLSTISLRAIMTWLYVNAGNSVFAAAVFHAMINLTWQLFPIHGSLYDPRVFGVITLVLAVMVYAVQRALSPGKRQAT